MGMHRDLQIPVQVRSAGSFMGERMFRFGAHKHLVSSICLAILFTFSLESHSEGRDAPFEDLMNQVARMACQIPPEDRSAVAVLAPVVDREGLQDCIGRPVVEAVIQVLHEFQFSLMERGLYSGEGINRDVKMKPSAVSRIAKRIGARSVLAGTVATDHEDIRVTYQMTRIEPMEIIGVFSCSLSKREFTDCLLKYDLSPPTLGIYPLFPEPRRIR